MKSQLQDMLEIWSAASYDAALACATSQVGRLRDLRRLTGLVRTRGLGVFTLDLPSLDNAMLELLEHGITRFEGNLCRRRSKKDIRPRFLWDFWTLVSDQDGCLLSNPSVEAMFAIRQLSSLWKKLEVDCSLARTKQAVEEFYAIEEAIPQPTLDWVGRSIDGHSELMFKSYPDLSRDPYDDGFLVRLDKVARILVSGIPIFDSLSEDSPEQGFYKHGPGAVSNLNSRSYKYTFPNWSESLERLFPFDWVSGASFGEFASTSIEPSSALLAVPKTAKAPRLIASEPLEHQWCQQKVKTFLDFSFQKSRIGKFFNPADQTLSQRLVALASHDRSLSTIDLSSASDRVRCSHIERIFSKHPSLLQAIMDTRTQFIEDRVTSEGLMPIRKFSTMGSALTFPMQSLFFLCVALASAGAHSAKTIDALVGRVRVFGDDIIVPTEAHVATVVNLTALGLKVNERKSFHQGFFRESCGSDCWRGYDITPVKPKTCSADTLVANQALLDTSNNLFLKGYWRCANTILEKIQPRFTRTVISLGRSKEALSSLPEAIRQGIQRQGTRVLGVVSYSGSRTSRIKYDSHLQREYAPISVVFKLQERGRQDNSFALREFFTRPYSSERARETGTKRITVAKVATVRVDAYALGLC